MVLRVLFFKITSELLADRENIHVIAGWPCYFGGFALLKPVPGQVHFCVQNPSGIFYSLVELH